MIDLDGVPDVATGGLLDGRYRLDERIGEGGAARVYRAFDTQLQRTVAVKIMRGPIDGADVIDRARAETRLLASLNHHSFVTLLDAHVSAEDGTYLVMELVEGLTLRDRIHQGALPERDVASIALDIAEALHVAHSAGIVHRDVKPGNILLWQSDLPGREWRAKLADLGIAHLLESERVTTPGLVLGTAAYIAPEQAQGAAPAPPADVYAFGITLLEALTGTRPFAEAEGIGAVLARLSSPPEIPEWLPAAWQGLLRGMTALHPEDRPTPLEIAAAVTPLALAPVASVIEQPTAAMDAAREDSAHLDRTIALPAAPAASSSSALAGSAGSPGSPPVDTPPVAAAVAAAAIAAASRSSTGPIARLRSGRRPMILAIVVGIVALAAAAAALWGLNLAGASPDPLPTTPAVSPSYGGTQPSDTAEPDPSVAPEDTAGEPVQPVQPVEPAPDQGNGGPGGGNGNSGPGNNNGNGNGNGGGNGNSGPGNNNGNGNGNGP